MKKFNANMSTEVLKGTARLLKSEQGAATAKRLRSAEAGRVSRELANGSAQKQREMQNAQKVIAGAVNQQQKLRDAAQLRDNREKHFQEAEVKAAQKASTEAQQELVEAMLVKTVTSIDLRWHSSYYKSYLIVIYI